MLLPALFLLVISVSMGLEQESCYLSEEEEDRCASVCYPIVKPLMRYFEVCQKKDRTNAELQNSLNSLNLKYSKLLEKYAENQTNSEYTQLLKNFNEVNSQNAKLQEQNSELNKNLTELNLKYVELQDEHSTAQDRCTKVQVNFEQEQEKCNQTSLELKSSQESLQLTNTQYTELKKKLDELNKKYVELQEEHSDALDRCTEVQGKTNSQIVQSQESHHQSSNSKYEQANFQEVNTDNNGFSRRTVTTQQHYQEQSHQSHVMSQSFRTYSNLGSLEFEKLKEQFFGNANNHPELNSTTNIEEKSEDPIDVDKTISNVTSVENLNNEATNSTASPSNSTTPIEGLSDSSSPTEDEGYISTEVQTTPSNSETPIEVPLDGCPLTQNVSYSYPLIQVPGFEPFEVGCYFNKEILSGWLIVYYKDEELTEFNRTYDEYIEGFGVVDTETFLGLEMLHILTNWKNHEVNILHSNGTSYQIRCANFVVGDESEGYMLKTLDGCTGDVEHFNLTQGSKFSTYDRDEDGDSSQNWAKEFGLGWWWPSSGTGFKKNEFLRLTIRKKD